MTRPINVLFVNQPSNPMSEIELSFDKQNEIFNTVVIPLGVLYLSSYLKQHVPQVRTDVIDYAYEVFNQSHQARNIDELIIRTAEQITMKPDILAFSAMFSVSHPFLLKAVELLSAFWPEATVIVGGNHATNTTKMLLENPDVDYVARGECEESFRQFVENFDDLPNHKIQGIYTKADIDAGVPLTISQYVDNLDDIPFPDWELIDMAAYTRSTTARARRNVDGADRRECSIMTTRGCPFSCTFCASHTVNGRKVRFRSVENVVKEIQHLYDHYGINLIVPEDDLFTANRRKVVPLLNAIKDFRETIPNFELQFPNALSVNTLFDDVMDALIEAGMKVTNVAIESGSPEVQRDVIKKRVNLDRAVEVVRYFRERGVTTRCYFIGGFPGETREQMLETIEYARNLRSDWCTFHIAAPLRGTEMYQQFVDAGYIKDDVATWSTAFFQERSFDTPEIGAEELKELFYRANLDVNFLHNPNLLEGNFEKALWIYRDIVYSYPFHIVGWYCIMKCHEALGDEDAARDTRARIYNLLQHDARARRMYRKYADLIPDIEFDIDAETVHEDETELEHESEEFLADEALSDEFLSSQVKAKKVRDGEAPDSTDGTQNISKRPRSPHQAPA
tara:strand:- start:56 stop:1918 length:1863 start_codon:yes stop_codon:yes gene_type:complete